MKGATTEPCAKISNPPIKSITRMIGANHNFFLTRRKAHSSLMISITTKFLVLNIGF